MTRLIATIGFVLALIFLNSEMARADSADTVQALYSNCRETAAAYDSGRCSGFIEGVAAMMNWVVCQETQTPTPTQSALVQAFQNWATTHSEAWSQSKVNGVVTALRATWPCARPPRY